MGAGEESRPGQEIKLNKDVVSTRVQLSPVLTENSGASIAL